MYTEGRLYVAHSDSGALDLCGKMANRHGLIAGATGTGKTVSLQVLAETFSQAGVPCFMADMKGDLSGISQKGTMSSFIQKRCPEFGIENPVFAGCPTRFWDVYGEKGFPMRTTVSAMGPMLMSRILDLNDVQSGVMEIIFRIADDQELLLIDLKDLRALLDYVGKNASAFTTAYGNISSASIGAIQRSLLSLESQGGDLFFGEPEFDVQDLLDCEGRYGIMNVLAADRLMMNPKLYSTFMLWLMTELYSVLPEVGDRDLPKLVFFFDEAHMLFDSEISKNMVSKVEQVVRLVRSKGVGIYFISQSPSDIPEDILGQLGNRIQHALRAYTPKDQKAVRAAAQTFRANPDFKTEDAIMNLGTGEALVSFLDEKGTPSIVQQAKILFPLSQIGAIDDAVRAQIMASASNRIKAYANAEDPESAFEVLTAKAEQARKAAEAAAEQARMEEEAARQEKEERRNSSGRSSGRGKSVARTIFGTMIGAAASSFARSLGTSVAKKATGAITGTGTAKSRSTSSSSRKGSSSSKTGSSSSKTGSTSSKSGKQSSTVLEKAVQSGVSSAFRKISGELVKELLK